MVCSSPSSFSEDEELGIKEATVLSQPGLFGRCNIQALIQVVGYWDLVPI
jgi:hypothetical protein